MDAPWHAAGSARSSPRTHDASAQAQRSCQPAKKGERTVRVPPCCSRALAPSAQPIITWPPGRLQTPMYQVCSAWWPPAQRREHAAGPQSQSMQQCLSAAAGSRCRANRPQTLPQSLSQRALAAVGAARLWTVCQRSLTGGTGRGVRMQCARTGCWQG